MKTKQEILRKITSYAPIEGRQFSLEEVLKAMDEMVVEQSHKHGIMQAEGSDGAEGAAVGQRSVGTNAEARGNYCKKCGCDLCDECINCMPFP